MGQSGSKDGGVSNRVTGRAVGITGGALDRKPFAIPQHAIKSSPEDYDFIEVSLFWVEKQRANVICVPSRSSWPVNRRVGYWRVGSQAVL